MDYFQLQLLEAEQSIEAEQYKDARLLLEKLLLQQPDNRQVQSLLSWAHSMEGNFEQAVQVLETMAASGDLMLEEGFRLAFGYSQLGNAQAALGCLQPLLELHPQLATLHHYKGVFLDMLKRAGEAHEAFLTAYQLSPDNTDIAGDLADFYYQKYYPELAEQVLSKALGKDPENAALISFLGRVYRLLGWATEAQKLRLKAMELAPDNRLIVSNHLYALCDSPELSATELAAEHFRLAEKYYPLKQSNLCVEGRAFGQGDKVSIGYVSGDFCTHSVSFFIEGVLQQHDYNKFDVYCYSTSNKLDATSKRIMALPIKWRTIGDLSTELATQLVRDDKIDILVDLSGHSSDNRLDLFAEQPARVQVSWIGYPHSTGLKQIDYYISDHDCNPPGNERFYSEKLFKLPRVFSCWLPPMEFPAIKPPAFVRNGYITFGSFNNYSKINQQTIELWADVLNAVPESRLYLKAPAFSHKKVKEHVCNTMLKKGIQTSRLQLERFAPTMESHLEQYSNIDIALDTWPYNGTTTTCEALWMGVPVVSLAGEHHISRVGLSFLRAVGLPELATENAADYVTCAVRLATDRERLRNLKSNLRQRMATSPLMDIVGVTRELEAAYLQMLGVAQVIQDSVVELYEQARQLYQAGDKAAASKSLYELLAQNPDFVKGWKKLAAIHNETGQHQEAINCLNRILQMEPGNVDCLADLAHLHSSTGIEPERGLQYAKRALQIRPNDVVLLNSCGRLLYELDQFQASIDILLKGLSIKSGEPYLLGNLGNSYLAIGETEKAIQAYSLALQQRPDEATLLSYRGFAYLKQGDYQQGWIDHEARLEDGSEITLMHQDLPRWDGGRIDGKTLLVWVEQVYGDSIQFARFIPLAKQLAGSNIKIILQVLNQNLAPLYKGFAGVDEIIIQGQPRPHADYQVPLCSLAGIVMAGGDTIPSPEGYLKADPGRKEHWCQLFNSLCKTDKPKIGLVWGGRKPRLNANRSMELHHLLPLFDVVDANWFSLQLGDDRQQLQQCDNPVIDLADYLTDFGEAAAAISNLDLLISIDTATAHLAGALGVPVWVMLKLSADWRWLRNRSDSPWYSSARLFRQKDAGDWPPVVAEVGQQLKGLLGGLKS